MLIGDPSAEANLNYGLIDFQNYESIHVNVFFMLLKNSC